MTEQELVAEVRRLNETIYEMSDTHFHLLHEKVRLRAALEFYADKESWTRQGDSYYQLMQSQSKIELDQGKRARDVLGVGK